MVHGKRRFACTYQPPQKIAGAPPNSGHAEHHDRGKSAVFAGLTFTVIFFATIVVAYALWQALSAFIQTP